MKDIRGREWRKLWRIKTNQELNELIGGEYIVIFIQCGRLAGDTNAKGNMHLRVLDGKIHGVTKRGRQRNNWILNAKGVNGLLGGRMSGYRPGQLLVLRMGNSWSLMNPKLANNLKMWKGNGNTTTLLFSLKDLKFYIERQENKWKPYG